MKKYSDPDRDRSDPDSRIKGRSKKRGAGAGNYWPMTQTNNKIIKRVTFTKCYLMTGPKENYNNKIQREL